MDWVKNLSCQLQGPQGGNLNSCPNPKDGAIRSLWFVGYIESKASTL